MFKNAVQLRGSILEATILIERKIDTFLALYFCASEEKKNEFSEYLLFTERITLENKRQIFAEIVKKHKSDFLKQNPDFLKGIENIVPHRNIFAHLESETSFSDVIKNKALVFKKYSNGKLNYKTYTNNDIDNLKKDITEIVNKLNALLLTTLI